ncbi:antitoxin of the YeeV-YeeU toxin-antitoxin system [Salmonella enterica subsp. enterica]|uniref:Antitoxin of the YeeV-YeeU toxin-antitoxin system n=1 Tax=Salmonella enterica I TaxID=59201 RepID=A0A379V1B1_SALET|nr:antitoxin of the YeeV-YeeU toxin-antitoxin system [Salmonella enterica subsp. enterica]
MLLSGELNPRHQHCVTLYAKGLVCEADSLGSCGYIYLAIYPGEPPENRRYGTMSRVISTTVYLSDELSESARKKARAWYCEGGLEYEWYDAVYEDFTLICNILGVRLKNTYLHHHRRQILRKSLYLVFRFLLSGGRSLL